MNGSELFETWAPADSVWSPWAKPALFADEAVLGAMTGTPSPPAMPPEPRSAFSGDSGTAFVLDLPGERSVELGLVLARAGYRPVPLFNTTDHAAALVDVRPVLRRLASGASELAGVYLPPEAPPAFLLDANRSNASATPSPGRYDNRWVVFPQDFPSASFLLARGIRHVVLLQEMRVGGGDQPQPDLAHVLRRWQEAGLAIHLQDPNLDERPLALDVRRPSSFRSLFYRALALAGLRRNSAGGFGGIIPQPSSGG
ncbi:MAG TPA: hypothetical protein VLE27_15355 [Thermoanaerobaculia bacterium]|nr:hypothetical protein [Thermoanaerobaculia bacterium]